MLKTSPIVLTGTPSAPLPSPRPLDPQVGRASSDPLACRACDGSGSVASVGQYAGRPCGECHGSAVAKCRDCAAEATVVDSNASELGGACIDCATRCAWPGCTAVATAILETTDDQGDATKLIDCCADCLEAEEDRIARIRRAPRASEWAQRVGV